MLPLMLIMKEKRSVFSILSWAIMKHLNKVDPHESLSLVPVLTGGKQPRDHAYIFNHAGTHAVIKGDYKLVREGRKRPWYLYNLAKNRTETINLAEKEPSLVAALEEIWENRWGRKKK